jgi:3-carboxy-cis,cis-muconate cycloisomerase
VEWAALRDLGRRTVVAASQTSDLLADLRVDTERMAANLDRAAGVDAEQRSMAALVEAEPSATYLGATPRWIEAAVRRGETYLAADGPDYSGGPEGPDDEETT